MTTYVRPMPDPFSAGEILRRNTVSRHQPEAGADAEPRATVYIDSLDIGCPSCMATYTVGETHECDPGGAADAWCDRCLRISMNRRYHRGLSLCDECYGRLVGADGVPV